METNKSIKSIAKSIVIALLLTLILLFIFSLIITYTNIQEQVIAPVIIVITAISILIGSSIAGIKIKKNGLLNGVIVGIGYILILYLISSMLNWHFELNINSIIMIAVAIIFGLIGGMIGVNIKT